MRVSVLPLFISVLEVLVIIALVISGSGNAITYLACLFIAANPIMGCLYTVRDEIHQIKASDKEFDID